MKRLLIIMVSLILPFWLIGAIRAEEWYEAQESTTDGTDYEAMISKDNSKDAESVNKPTNEPRDEQRDKINELRNVTGAKAADSKHVTLFQNNKDQWRAYRNDIAAGGRRRMGEQMSSRGSGNTNNPNEKWYNYWHDTLAGLGGASPDAPDTNTTNLYPN